MNNTIIWELPIRLFHWGLTILVFALLGSGFAGASEQHIIIGQILLGFLIFRFIWGFIGGYYTRFSTGIALLLGKMEYDGYGHTKKGWLSVFAIMGVLLIQLGMGMVATTDEYIAGPWSQFIGYDLAREISFMHAEIGAKIVILLIIFHILAIFYYLNEKNPQIVGSMIHGRREKEGDKPQNVRYSFINLLVAVVASVGLTIILGNL